MLRLHGSCFFHERLLTFEGEDWLSVHAGLRLIPCSISCVAMVGEMDDILKVGSVSFRQTIFMCCWLDSVDQLDWGAAGVESMVFTMGQNDSYNK